MTAMQLQQLACLLFRRERFEEPGHFFVDLLYTYGMK